MIPVTHSSEEHVAFTYRLFNRGLIESFITLSPEDQYQQSRWACVGVLSYVWWCVLVFMRETKNQSNSLVCLCVHMVGQLMLIEHKQATSCDMWMFHTCWTPQHSRALLPPQLKWLVLPVHYLTKWEIWSQSPFCSSVIPLNVGQTCVFADHHDITVRLIFDQHNLMSVDPWVQVDTDANFEEIPSRCSWENELFKKDKQHPQDGDR